MTSLPVAVVGAGPVGLAAAAHLIMVSTLPDHLDCSAEGTAFYQFKYLNLAVLRPTSSPSASRGPPRSIHPDRPAMAGAAATADHAGRRFNRVPPVTPVLCPSR